MGHLIGNRMSIHFGADQQLNSLHLPVILFVFVYSFCNDAFSVSGPTAFDGE
jgi:hypothetical protein